MRTFGYSDFWFIIEAAQWTIALSIMAFIGGGIVGLIVALVVVNAIAWTASIVFAVRLATGSWQRGHLLPQRVRHEGVGRS